MVPILAEWISGKDPDAREAACVALCILRRKASSAIPALETAAEDPDEDVRLAAHRVLSSIR